MCYEKAHCVWCSLLDSPLSVTADGAPPLAWGHGATASWGMWL